MNTSRPSGISITVNALAKRYHREWIFRKMEYSFHGGKTYAITGPNGSGKSTLLQVLWGQTPPSAGTITYSIGGKTISVEEYFKFLSIATPYMDLIDEFTLLEQLTFHSKIKKFRKGLTPEVLVEKMSLTESRNKQIGNFSSGMRQRVKLCLAFSTESQVIFLDEPGTNLDKTAFEWYQQQLSGVDPDALILIASNNPQEYLTAHEIINIMDFK